MDTVERSTEVPPISCSKCESTSHTEKNCQAPLLPLHWDWYKSCQTIGKAKALMSDHGMKHDLVDISTCIKEWMAVEDLTQDTWDSLHAGHGADARNLSHDNIQVEKIERVENPEVFENYLIKKHKLQQSLKGRNRAPVQPVSSLAGSSGPIRTTALMDKDNCLLRNIDLEINEGYLFHGTKEDTVTPIVRDGLDNRFGNRHALLGPGLYTAESSTKSDQYADSRSDRTDDLKKMFLVRVLLGRPYINNDPNPPKFIRPPCLNCQQMTCQCKHADQYDSVIDDARRLFREFIVYEQCQCYPEYLITYKRITGVPSRRKYFLLPVDDSSAPDPNPPASAFGKVCAVLCALVVSSAWIISSCMMAVGRIYLGDCPGFAYIPIYLLLIGVVTFTFLMVLPFMLMDFFGKGTNLWSRNSFKVVLGLCFALPGFAIQSSGWALVYTGSSDSTGANASSPDYCSGFVAKFARETTSYLTVLYCLTPLCLFGLSRLWRPLYDSLMGLFAVMSLLVLAGVLGIMLVLPIPMIIIGGISVTRCTSLTKLLPTYLIGCSILFVLIYVLIALAIVLRKGITALVFAIFFLIVLFIFQCFGWAMVYPYKANPLNDDDYLSSGEHCDKTVYQFAFTVLTFTTALWIFYLPIMLLVSLVGYKSVRSFVSSSKPFSDRWTVCKQKLSLFKSEVIRRLAAVLGRNTPSESRSVIAITRT